MRVSCRAATTDLHMQGTQPFDRCHSAAAGAGRNKARAETKRGDQKTVQGRERLEERHHSLLCPATAEVSADEYGAALLLFGDAVMSQCLQILLVKHHKCRRPTRLTRQNSMVSWLCQCHVKLQSCVCVKWSSSAGAFLRAGDQACYALACRTVLPRIVQSWLRNYLACMALYFGVSGAWAYYVYWCFGGYLYGKGNMPAPADVLEQAKARCLLSDHHPCPSLPAALATAVSSAAVDHIHAQCCQIFYFRCNWTAFH